MKCFYIPEPELIFKGRNTCTHPKVGLLNFGPIGLSDNELRIPVGIIGTRESKNLAKTFLTRLQYAIDGNYYPASNVRSIDFPGLHQNGPLGYYFSIDENLCEEISEDLVNEILNKNDQRDAAKHLGLVLKQALNDLSGVHQIPKLVFIAIPEKLLIHCKKPDIEEVKITISDRSFSDLQQIALLVPQDRPLYFDLHNYLKVIGFQLNIPTQILKPSTMLWKGSQSEDPATIAWNICVASYYKSTMNPWKLADLEPETIHVGISFYNDIGYNNDVIIRAAIAQVYMRTGDSQVTRGLEIPVETEEENRNRHLTENQAEDILNKAINLYFRKHHRNPARVVVHKKSEYDSNERNGFTSAAQGIEIQDYLYITKKPDFRIITPTTYPIMRGSVFQTRFKNNLSGFYISTTRYVPALDTYPGSSVPMPIRIIIDSAMSNVNTLATDIMNLTKLDWNSSNFSKRMPATLSVSEKIGNIMGEINIQGIEPPNSYVWYM